MKEIKWNCTSNQKEAEKGQEQTTKGINTKQIKR